MDSTIQEIKNLAIPDSEKAAILSVLNDATITDGDKLAQAQAFLVEQIGEIDATMGAEADAIYAEEEKAIEVAELEFNKTIVDLEKEAEDVTNQTIAELKALPE